LQVGGVREGRDMWEEEMSVAPMTFQNRAFKVVALTYNGIDSLREWKLSKQE